MPVVDFVQPFNCYLCNEEINVFFLYQINTCEWNALHSYVYDDEAHSILYLAKPI